MGKQLLDKYARQYQCTFPHFRYASFFIPSSDTTNNKSSDAASPAAADGSAAAALSSVEIKQESLCDSPSPPLPPHAVSKQPVCFSIDSSFFAFSQQQGLNFHKYPNRTCASMNKNRIREKTDGFLQFFVVCCRLSTIP